MIVSRKTINTSNAHDVLEVVKHNGSFFQRAHENLRNDREFVLKAVSLNKDCQKFTVTLEPSSAPVSVEIRGFSGPKKVVAQFLNY